MSEQEFNQLVNEFESLTKILTNTHELRERVEMKLRPMMQELGYSKIEGEGFEIISAPRLSPTVQDTIRQLKQLTKHTCLLYTSPSPRDGLLSRMPSSA